MGRMRVEKFGSRSPALARGAIERKSDESKRTVVVESVRNRMESLFKSLDQGMPRLLGVVRPVFQIEHSGPSIHGLFREGRIILYIRFDLSGDAVDGRVVVVFLNEGTKHSDELF